MNVADPILRVSVVTQSSGGPIVVLYMLPFAAAMILLAVRIWSATARPASQPQPKPASVAV